ncbi:MAG: hypothetical protein GX964_06620 [Syntrophomonadaceae bacterium]|nr:hypothetical protein [Syntrophomonadaceae bacterium]
MDIRKVADTLIEVIGIKEDNCINCHQCISVCPVKICSDGSGDVVKFNNQLCIGCGRCIEACIKSHGGTVEKSARIPIDDTSRFMKALSSGHDIVALVAPSAHSNFDVPKMITGLKHLGVKAVYDVALGAEMVVTCYHEAITSGKAKLPMIAQTCPAVVKYIELYQPALIEHLAPTGSPVHDLAVYVKSLHPHCEVAFISPCLAKRREFQDSRMVEYNVIYQSLARLFAVRDIKLSELDDSQFDQGVPAGIAANFPTPGGLKQAYLYKYPDTKASDIIQVEGPIIYTKYLPDLVAALQNGNSNLPIIIDILSCEKGCNMGAGCISHHKSIDEIEKTAARRAENAICNERVNQQREEFLQEVAAGHNFDYHEYRDLSAYGDSLEMPNHNELQKIYQDMHKEEEKDFRNCAACGYNSCYHMAIAIHNDLNKVENCHLYQEKELRQEHEILNKMVEELAQLNRQLHKEIAERKQQEQLLVQNSKLAAMGEMMGMIAHQWRQPLSAISTVAGNLQVCIELDMYDEEQFKEMLNEINDHAQYLSDTINDFRHFFKPDNPEDTVMLSQIMEDTLSIIGKSLEYKNVQLIKDYSFSVPILTYPNELRQVFLNILKNASDAFIEANVLEPEIVIRGYETESFQVMQIEDNGGGIPEAFITKIFEPYFSTKGPGTGTGLGLYMSKMIVEEHCRGDLRVTNTDKGACFTIRLPV